MDIKNLKEVMKLSFDGVKLGIEIKKDGKLGFAQIPLALSLVQDLPPAIEGIDQVPAELKDLSNEEAAELVAYIVSELAVDDEKAKLIINSSFKALLANIELVKSIQS